MFRNRNIQFCNSIIRHSILYYFVLYYLYEKKYMKTKINFLI